MGRLDCCAVARIGEEVRPKAMMQGLDGCWVLDQLLLVVLSLWALGGLLVDRTRILVGAS